MIVLIAHGSRDPRWRKSLEDLSVSVREPDGSKGVGLAFMQFEGPTLPEVIEKGVAEGVVEFHLLPLFMASAGHVDKDIRPLVEELRGRFPRTTLELLTPIGEDPLFHELIQTIANKNPTEDRS
jgi:sirohydrochlorin cobaltochelatase